MEHPNISAPASTELTTPVAGKVRPINPNAFSYTLTDAVAMSGLSIPTLRRREKDGALVFTRVGGRTLVNGDSLRRMVGAAN